MECVANFDVRLIQAFDGTGLTQPMVEFGPEDSINLDLWIVEGDKTAPAPQDRVRITAASAHDLAKVIYPSLNGLGEDERIEMLATPIGKDVPERFGELRPESVEAFIGRVLFA
jgi:hypothetical protein